MSGGWDTRPWPELTLGMRSEGRLGDDIWSAHLITTERKTGTLSFPFSGGWRGIPFSWASLCVRPSILREFLYSTWRGRRMSCLLTFSSLIIRKEPCLKHSDLRNRSMAWNQEHKSGTCRRWQDAFPALTDSPVRRQSYFMQKLSQPLDCPQCELCEKQLFIFQVCSDDLTSHAKSLCINWRKHLCVEIKFSPSLAYQKFLFKWCQRYKRDSPSLASKERHSCVEII